MMPIKDMLKQTTPNMTLDSDVEEQYRCSGCEESVSVKQMIMPFGPQKGKLTTLSFGCKCEEKQIVQALLRKREERRKQRFYDLFDENSLINDQLKRATFENYETVNDKLGHAFERALHFAESFSKTSPQNLILSGSYGIGKSHLARSITNVIMKKEYTTIFISVPKLLTKLKATYNRKSEHTEDDLLSLLEKVDCLVLDDIGAEYGTDHSGSWATSKVFEVVDSRIGKHTVYTTNLNGEALQAKVGPRNFSRMIQDTEVVTMHGEDYRLNHFK